MLHRGQAQAQLGSPRNISINVLNANTFFTLDYQNTSNHKNNSHACGFSCQKKNVQTMAGCETPTVRSAQYTRKALSGFKNFRIKNNYNRIRKVEDIIKQRKKILNLSIELNKPEALSQENKVLPEIKQHQQKHPRQARIIKEMQFEKKKILQKQQYYNHYLFDTLPHGQSSGQKKIQRIPQNKFNNNEKNRRKLTQRIGQKRSNSRNSSNASPLRRDISPNQFMQRQEAKNKYWNPYPGKLNLKKNLQFLQRQSLNGVNGNKINYNFQDPQKIERYRQLKQIVQKNV